jgi:DNA-binding NarL/FixJ family response regulator
MSSSACRRRPRTHSALAEAFHTIDVTDLAPRVQAPTIVFHARGDEMVPFTDGRRLAAAVANARFVPLDGRNHVFLREEPAWQTFLAGFRSFVGVPVSPADGELGALSPRQLQVLELVASGLTNEEIAARLYLSVRTVERHLANIYKKLGLSGKAARAAVAARMGQLSSSP